MPSCGYITFVCTHVGMFVVVCVRVCGVRECMHSCGAQLGVCPHVCMVMCLHALMCVCSCAACPHVGTLVCLCACMPSCVHVYVFACPHVGMFMCLHALMWVHACIYVFPAHFLYLSNVEILAQSNSHLLLTWLILFNNMKVAASIIVISQSSSLMKQKRINPREARLITIPHSK